MPGKQNTKNENNTLFINDLQRFLGVNEVALATLVPINGRHLPNSEAPDLERLVFLLAAQAWY